MEASEILQKLKDIFSQDEIEKDYYTCGEVAERVGRTVGTVRNWCRWGQIEVVKRGKRWRIPRRELRRLVESGCELNDPILENIPPSLRVRYDSELREKINIAIA